ncbi:hypothetical protein HPB51_012156 [Rhipicephalus microplus]|uniref:Secreted protein n=1 Tax=Rhipicephalus microplus TaxID=6941 RepID=A0A9J6DMV3_RHIMP|nr:hypothetical protein HPB51_012156 [Rhipicephalus microplus]
MRAAVLVIALTCATLPVTRFAEAGVPQAPTSNMCVLPSANYVVASISRLAKTVLKGSRSYTLCAVVAVSVPDWLVLRHRPRNANSTLRTSSSLRHPPRMLGAEGAPASGDAREVASVPGAVVPPWDVPARAPGRQNVPGGVPRLSLPPQGGGTFRRGRPGPAPARPPPLTARSRRSPVATRPEEGVCLLEATNGIAVLPTRVSSTRCDELTSS